MKEKLFIIITLIFIAFNTTTPVFAKGAAAAGGQDFYSYQWGICHSNNYFVAQKEFYREGYSQLFPISDMDLALFRRFGRAIDLKLELGYNIHTMDNSDATLYVIPLSILARHYFNIEDNFKFFLGAGITFYESIFYVKDFVRTSDDGHILGKFSDYYSDFDIGSAEELGFQWKPLPNNAFDFALRYDMSYLNEGEYTSITNLGGLHFKFTHYIYF
ncbi:MAG: hypothetical protein QG635_2361 [Bacteroidota bacterium]|nr:hypothetical protein [Bacteroidota bacterium]